jgi:hypothetical protein
MTHAEMDSRKASAVYNEASNQLTYLAEIFNDYEEFCPQNVMLQYISTGQNQRPMKKNPYQASQTEWAFFSKLTHDLELTNVSRQERGLDQVHLDGLSKISPPDVHELPQVWSA